MHTHIVPNGSLGHSEVTVIALYGFPRSALSAERAVLQWTALSRRPSQVYVYVLCMYVYMHMYAFGGSCAPGTSNSYSAVAKGL